MNRKKLDQFFACFGEAFRKVLSQYSGADWSVAEASLPDLAITELIWFSASVSGSTMGSFAFGLPRQSALLLAQVLMALEAPANEFNDEQKEATHEFLQQVCGQCATELTHSLGQTSLTVGAGGLPAWTISEQRIFEIAEITRTAIVTIAIDPVLLASLSEPPSEPTRPRESGLDTDRPALRQALGNRNLDLLLDVHLGVRLRFGSRRMKLREILEFHPGTIVELDRQVQEPVDLLVDNKLIARGEVVVVDGNYGLKIREVLSPQQCVAALY